MFFSFSLFFFPRFFCYFLSFSFLFSHFLSFSFMFFHVLSCSDIFCYFLSCPFIFFHFLSFSFHFLSGAQKNLIFLGLNFVTISLDNSDVKKQFFGPVSGCFFFFFLCFFKKYFSFFLHFSSFLFIFHFFNRACRWERKSCACVPRPTRCREMSSNTSPWSSTTGSALRRGTRLYRAWSAPRTTCSRQPDARAFRPRHVAGQRLVRSLHARAALRLHTRWTL